MNVENCIVLLIVLAIITQHIVAWAGSVLHEVGMIGSDYAVFTFRDDRNQSMTTNVIMNIFIPNVVMVFIYMVAQYLKIDELEKNLLIYIVAFYVYRMVLICIILRRKEMYSIRYELGIALVAFLLAWGLKNYFFTSVDNIFISATELKDELWIAIIVVLYQFVKQLLSKKVSQDTVLTKGQISRYIIKKFNKFFKKYNNLMDITSKNHEMYIFLYAIMIFEDYNRGPFIRFFERIKVHLGKSATVGIMQIKSSVPLSDEESILKSIRWIERKIDIERANWDVMSVNELAWDYNHSNAYAKSVAYIYDCLSKYIDEVPKYRKIFCTREDKYDTSTCVADKRANEEKYTQFECNDSVSLRSCIHNNSYISLELGQYDLLENCNEVTAVELVEVFDGQEVVIREVNNVYIKGNGAELIVTPRYATVLTFVNCHDIVLDNLKIGHTPAGVCSGGVLKFVNCSNIRLKKLELYGCGVMGISSYGSNLYVEDCKIHSCTYGAIELNNTKCELDRVEIFDCKDTCCSIITANSSNLIMTNLVVRDCSSKKYIVEAHDTAVISNNFEVYACQVDKEICNCDIA